MFVGVAHCSLPAHVSVSSKEISIIQHRDSDRSVVLVCYTGVACLGITRDY